MKHILRGLAEIAASIGALMAVLLLLHPLTMAQSEKTYTPTYIIQTTVSGNGTAAPLNAAVKQGKSKIIRLTPAAGYWIQQVTVNGTDVTGALSINRKTGAASVKITEIQADTQIRAVFGLDTRPTPTPTPPKYMITINSTSPQHGQNSYTKTVKEGKAVTITMDDCDFAGFQEEGVSQVRLDGADITNQIAIKPCTGSGKLKLENVTQDHVIDYTLAIITPCPTPAPKYKVTTHAYNGTITPSTFTVQGGKTRDITIKPSNGYYIRRLYIGMRDDTANMIIDQRGIGHYTYNASTAKGDDIDVSFERIDATPTPTPTPTPGNCCTVTITSEGNGTVTPGTFTQPCGTKYVAVRFFPGENNALKDVLLNGQSVIYGLTTSDQRYQWSYFCDNYTMHAIFAQATPTPTPTRTPTPTPTRTPTPTPTRTPTPTYTYRYITITSEGSMGDVNTGVKKVIDGSTLYIDWVMYGTEPVSVTLDGINVLSQTQSDPDGNYTLKLNNITADHAVHINLGD